MRTKTKKAISLILAICMVLVLIPTGAASAITLSANSALMVSAGGSHTLMIREDGTLWAWGAGQYGQLGDGDTSNHNLAVPAQIPLPADATLPWVYVAAGGLHSAAIDSAGVLWTWGAAGQGQLGNNATTDSGTPAQVSEPGPWRSVSAGARHTVGIKEDGTLWAWGENAQGAIGQGNVNSPSQYDTPQQVPAASGNTWLAVSAGGYWDGVGLSYGGHTIGIQSDGSLWAWGWNQSGQVGNGTITSGSPYGIGTPTNITPAGTAWSNVSAGSWSSLAIDSGGTLWGWGANGNYQLGLGAMGDQDTPQQISTATNWQSVSAGRYHVMGIRTDGTLWGWGENDEGWLGNGTTATNQTPLQIGTDTNWVSVSAAWYHTAAVKEDGSLWTAGSNGALQLGNGDTTTGNDVYVFSLIQAAIAIVTQPTDVTVTAGQISGSLSVEAIGSLTSGGLSYQWYSTPDGTVGSGVAITGETNADFTIPTTLTAGLYYYYAVISGAGADAMTSQVATVTVTDAPTYGITLNPATDFDFGTVIVGYASQTPYSVTINNTGNQATGALTIALSGTDAGSFTLSATAITDIAVGGSDSFTVVPNDGLAAGAYTATITVSGGNSISAMFNVTFTVQAVPTYGITLNPATDFDFGTVNVGYASQTPYSVTINNTGNQATGALTIALSGTDAGSFTLSTTAITDIAVGGSDSFTVVPNDGLAAGAYTATVTVSGGNGISATFNVTFTVDVATYGISLDQSGTYTFPAAMENYTTAPGLTVTVTNTGNQATGDLTAALSAGGTSSFELSTVTIPGLAAAGDTTTFTVAPSVGLAAGTYTDTVTISGGNGISATFNVSFTVTAQPAYGITLNPAGDFDFGTVIAGYASQTPYSVTINNTGDQATGALTIALSGADAGSFILSTTAITDIAVGGSDSFTVVPNDGLAAGAYTATVTVSGGNGISATFNVTFTVDAATYGISLDQSGTYTFPVAMENYTTVPGLTVTVTNTGNQATGALTIALSGTDAGSFILSTTAITDIAVGGSDSFTVVPNDGLAVGAYTATVTVSGGNGISATFDVSFTVTAQPAYGITLNPATDFDFGTVIAGYASQTPYSVTINNTGDQATGALTIALSGTDAGSFTLSMTAITDIAVGGSDSFTVVPNDGLAAGAYTATVTVSGGNGISATFNVTFTVTDTGAPPFLDTVGHWADRNGSIAFAYNQGLMLGTSATTFEPDGDLTRGAAVTILYRMAGEPSVTFSPVFTDVPDGQWYSAAAVWANQTGLVQGYGGLYRPNDPATFQELVTMFYRFAAMTGHDVTVPPGFALTAPDADLIAGWAQEAMLWANYNGIIIGSPDGTLNPLKPANRAEAATILMRFMA